jgi:hypothetical protein
MKRAIARMSLPGSHGPTAAARIATAATMAVVSASGPKTAARILCDAEHCHPAATPRSSVAT